MGMREVSQNKGALQTVASPLASRCKEFALFEDLEIKGEPFGVRTKYRQKHGKPKGQKVNSPWTEPNEAFLAIS